MPYNKLLINLACSSRTGEYWPSVVFIRTSLRLVGTVTTSGQYSPVRPSRSASKRLLKVARYLISHFCNDRWSSFDFTREEKNPYIQNFSDANPCYNELDK